MTDFKITKWEYSDREQKPKIGFEEGLRTLKITSAQYDPDTTQYTLGVTDLVNDAEFRLSWWLKSEKVKGSGVLDTDNNTSIGTLVSLGKALYNINDIGVPAPSDVLGRVVIANVKASKPANSGFSYPRVYEFAPAFETESWASDAPQYFKPSA